MRKVKNSSKNIKIISYFRNPPDMTLDVSSKENQEHLQTKTGDFSRMINHSLRNSKNSPLSSSSTINSTNPLALRKRNREPYNPYPDSKDHTQYGLQNGKYFNFQ